ncbi:MAG: glycosyltransferase family 2 protein, partial [Phocaeicola sp.]
VSIIVPNYNYESYLQERVESILQQTYTNYELILLDDCSTDNSTQILSTYSTHAKVAAYVVNEKNSGSPFLQWEKGISLAKGEYIWIAESDDFADVTLLEKCVNALDSHPKAVLARTGSYLVDSLGAKLDMDYDNWKENNNPLFFKTTDYVKYRLFWRNDVYNASMVLFRKSNYMQMSKAYKKMRYAGDWLFWIDLLTTGEGVVEIREKLNRFRQHMKRVTVNSTKELDCYKELITIRKKLFELYPMSNYCTWLVKGLTYKDLRRAEKKVGISILPLAKKELGLKKRHYFFERTIKSFTNYSKSKMD